MSLTIVMYHYVRDLACSAFPRIKGLDVKAFEGQLDYIQKHYEVVTAEAIIAALSGDNELPDMAALLTFDDGYSDHFEYVFPRLRDRRLQGLFFAPGKAVMESQVLAVNKIQFILAAVSDPSTVFDDLIRMLDEDRDEFSLETTKIYLERHLKPSRFDENTVAFVKTMLQKGLSKPCRDRFICKLFKKYVTDDETGFAEDLYLTMDKIQTMRSNGMYFGSHGYGHDWLDQATPKEQERDIDDSLALLARVGTPLQRWIMCYPYGAFNESLVRILRERNCVVGLTTRADVASLQVDDPMALPRLDTNDLPKQGDAAPNAWTARA